MLCQFAVEQACRCRMRIDVVVWDMQDSRHDVPRVDEIADLQRMYYHLFKNVLRMRWPNGSVWRLCPDEHTAMDWGSVEDYLGTADGSTALHADLFTAGRWELRLQREFGIEQVSPCPSVAEPLIQLADLFAGMAVFSRDSYEPYLEWKRSHGPQLALPLGQEQTAAALSGSSKERFPVLEEFYGLCKRNRLGVSLKSHRGLRTLDPKNPINFWWYEPQSQFDKAPVRCERRSG